MQPLLPDCPKIEKARRRQYRNVLERRHVEKVPVPRDQAARCAHQRRLQQLVVIGIPAPEFRAGDRNPFGDRFELGRVDSPHLRADKTNELREMQSRSQLVKRVVGKQQQAALLSRGVDECPWPSFSGTMMARIASPLTSGSSFANHPVLGRVVAEQITNSFHRLGREINVKFTSELRELPDRLHQTPPRTTMCAARTGESQQW